MTALAASGRESAPVAFLRRNPGLWITAAVVAMPLGVIVGIPPAAIDFLLVLNLAVSVLILAVAVSSRGVLAFSVFPSLLLVTTLFRLVLNIATTRLILSNAADREQAAGRVVQAFGTFVAGDNAFVGFILFAILVAVQFAIVTKGAGRVSEVAARFALDGMPGRQMAIDADLTAGAIAAEEAQVRRRELAREADFYGAMDGAAKFVRGDAVVGLLIVGINILGGLAIGLVQHGMGLAEAAEVFTRLTIGDGLVTQLPALLVALAAGFVVTRSTAQAPIGRELTDQVLGVPAAIGMAAAFLGALLLTPLPKPAVLGAGAGLALVAYGVRRRETNEAADRAAAARRVPAPEMSAESLLELDPLEVELGAGLLRLVTGGPGALPARIEVLRREIAREMGVVVPPIRVRDNLELPPRRYAIKLRGVEIARGEREEDGAEGVLARLREALSTHLPELLTRLEMVALLDRFRTQRGGRGGKLVDEVVDRTVRSADVQKVLQNLLREQVPVRDLELILETLGDRGGQVKDPAALTELVRQALGRQVCRPYLRDGVLHCVTLDPGLETDLGSALPVREEQGIVERIARAALRLAEKGRPPVVLCSPAARPLVKRATDLAGHRLAVLSFNEVPPDVGVESIERVG